MEIFKLMGRILVDNDEANRSISQTDKSAKGLGERLGSGIKTAAKWGAGIATAAATVGAAAFGMANKVAGGFDDISKGAQRAGVATDYYQEMDYWASQNGMSQENMEKAVGRLNQRVGKAADGNEKYAGALETLGVNLDGVRDGTVSTEDAMTQSIQSLSEMENANEQAAVASELFGTKLGREMLPALQEGALSIEDAQKQAEELGIVIGEDMLDSGVKFQDTWDNLQRSASAVGQQLMGQLIPIFQSLMDWVIENMPLIQSTFETVFGVIQTVFSMVVGWVQTAIGWFNELYTNNQETFMGIWETIQQIFTQTVEFLQEAWAFIREFWTEHGQAIMTNAMEIFTNIYETVSMYITRVREIIEEVLGYVVPWVQEKLQVLLEFWRQNGEQIMQAVSNAFEIIRSLISVAMDIVQGTISGAWTAISSIFDAAIGIVMGLVKTFSSLLTGDFEGIKEGLSQIWDSLWDGIKGVVDGAWGMLSGAFGALWDNISEWFSGLKDDALEWGGNMITGFIDGIKGKIGAVGEAASNIASTVGGWLGFSSPADKGEGRFIEEWGANMIDGFLDGVDSKIGDAGLKMDAVVRSMQPDDLESPNIEQKQGSRMSVETIEELLLQLIVAVQENRVLQIGNKQFEEYIGDTAGDQGGERIRRRERGLAQPR